MVEGEPAPRVFKLAIAALGGQGGGVLTQWLLDAAEAGGFMAQSTSVPGVAQRTGATLYYLELFPRAAAEAAGADPVLALMPQPGNVDLVVASELMEAGRAMQRGLVTRERTTLVASTHRVFTIGEKSALGDGLADSDSVLEVARATAKRLVALDMEALAREHGSVISSVVLGALAGSGALPFAADACEQAIRASGRALERNLAAYAAGKARAEATASRDAGMKETPRGKAVSGAAVPASARATKPSSSPDLAAEVFDPPPAPRNPKAKALMERVSNEFPGACANMLGIGVHRLVDYQNHRYAGLYLDRLRSILELDSAGRQHALLLETARGLALWMSYEDTARVADLKTRAARFARVRAETGSGSARLMRIVDYLSPRVEEICGSLPAWLGAPLMKWSFSRRILQAFTGGKKISTDRLWGYLLMRAMARTRAWRLSSLRHREEDARIRQWLATLAELAPQDYELAVEMAACQQLVKGYGETFERGLSRYQAIREALPALRGANDAAGAVRELCEAALADEEGREFEAALARLCENRPADAPWSTTQTPNRNTSEMKTPIAKLLNAGPRAGNLLGAAACFGLFGYALFAEHVQGYEPCPLCLLQRFAVVGMGLAFLLAALHRSAGMFRHAYSALCATIGLAGGGVAVRHLWIQNQPEGAVPPCGASFDFIVENFGVITAVREALTASGECAEVDWSLLGLSMPGWVLLALLGLTAWAVWTNSFARRHG